MFVYNGIERQAIPPAGCEVVDVDIGVSVPEQKSLIIDWTQQESQVMASVQQPKWSGVSSTY